jgi:hypothetical protein
MAFDGEVFEPTLYLRSISDVIRPLSKGEEFSLVGDVDTPVDLSIALSDANSRGGSGAPVAPIVGDND